MKLAILLVIFFIALPWRLAAPVIERTVIEPVPQEVVAEKVAPVAKEDPVIAEVQTKPSVAVTQPAPAQTHLVPQNSVEYTEEYVEELEKAIHIRINAERVNQGLNELTYNDFLAQIAASHSTDMAEENYFEHADENGCTVSCRVTNAGYDWRMVGENLFLLGRQEHFTVEGAAAVVVAGWMGSPGHRKNLFEKDFKQEGIGVVIKGDAIYVTEVLTRPR